MANEGQVGNFVIAVYTPLKGKENELLHAIKDHLQILRQEKLATNYPALVLRSSDGSILEIFEWVSPEAVEAAHKNPAVLKLWDRFHAVCEYRPLATLKEAQSLFAHFDIVTL